MEMLLKLISSILIINTYILWSSSAGKTHGKREIDASYESITGIKRHPRQAGKQRGTGTPFAFQNLNAVNEQ
jgi:hypothetical protein